MATPIVPPVPPTIPQRTTGPADGDVADAASVNVAFEDLMSGVQGLRSAFQGVLPNLHAASTDGENIVFDALGGFVVTSAGVWTSLSSFNATTANAAGAFGGPLAPSTRYYLYVYDFSGAPDVVVVTTPPNASRTYQNADQSRQFVTTFVTDSSGVIIPYVQSGRSYTYMSPIAGPSAAMSGGAGVWTDVNLNASVPLVPSFAQSVRMSAILLNSDTTAGGDTFLVRPKGITATGYTTTQSAEWVLGAVDHYAQNIFATFEVTLGPTALFQYKWVTGGVGRSAVGYVVGWSY